MANDIAVSIILCTRDRVSALRLTLESLKKAWIAPETTAEIIVVDNGSTDDTAEMVRGSLLRNFEVQYLFEPTPGKSNGLNLALAHARGKFLLFTDDDVDVAEDWVQRMISRIVDNGCDAVTGEITLAPHLERPWMSSGQRWWLASSRDARSFEGHRELIGANMGFRRSVLDCVPGFDPELGPGALGLGEDTLFGWQLVEAGFTIEYAPEARVLHRLDVSRLKRVNWLGEARKHGRTEAYQAYHWLHEDVRNPHLRWILCLLKLQLRRTLEPVPPLQGEGCPGWELSYVSTMARCRQFCFERRRPRNYSPRGLVKHGFRPPSVPEATTTAALPAL